MAAFQTGYYTDPPPPAVRKPDFFTRVVHFFTRHPLWLKVLEWSKTHSLPGLKRIPLYNLVSFIYDEVKEDAMVTRANSMAFSFFQAIFPGIIVLISLLPYFPISMDFFGMLQKSIKEIMPGSAGDMIFKTVKDIATIPRSGVLSFGFFLALWFASNGMLSMMQGLEKDYPTTFKQRSEFHKRLISIQLTFLVAFVLVASMLLIILGDTILNFVFQYIHVDALTEFAFSALRWVAVLLLFYTTFSTIYRFGSSTWRPIPFFNPGAMLATLLSILISSAFSFYVDNFGNYNKLYGSIGTLIVLMIWIQMNCMILLIGFELNAGIAVLRDRRQAVREEVEISGN
ncbi:MAG: YihY/virulence factor BrkB family protein [Saprospiraceae bacterium]|nr:YihY/virulence factor BrkB family protein [Saprospiraceae bacterium]